MHFTCTVLYMIDDNETFTEVSEGIEHMNYTTTLVFVLMEKVNYICILIQKKMSLLLRYSDFRYFTKKVPATAKCDISSFGMPHT